jgi:uncharacterized protein
MDKSVLKRVIIDQKEMGLPDPLTPRWQYHAMMPLMETKQVIILSGIRRCGKSTLMQMIRHHANEVGYYINFDDDRLVHFALEDFDQLLDVLIELDGLQNTFYFDEIQNISGWERFVRRLHNEGKKVVITGSNARLLSRELGTHLTGRHIAITLYPYSFSEFVASRDPHLLKEQTRTSTHMSLLKKYFSEFKILGGMPEYLENNQRQYLHALYENILYKDIIVRHKLTHEKSIKELVYYLASNNTKEFSYNRLCQLLGIASTNTISDYCHYLENSFLCFTLNRFSYSLKKQIHSPKKIYFIDPALAESVGFRFSPDHGRTLENIVFLQLMRQSHDIYFHKEQQECDFVIREGYHITQAIQVSVSLIHSETKKREINGLLDALIAYQLPEGLVITEDESGIETHLCDGKTYTIHIVPCWQWLLDCESL